MVSYLDTSFLYTLYVTEALSTEAMAWFTSYAGEAALSSLTDVELVSSLFRNEPQVEAAKALAAYRADSALGIYKHVEITSDVYRGGQEIAEIFAGPLKLRSLDILHLATAQFYKVDALATFDTRLAAGAKALGLEVLP